MDSSVVIPIALWNTSQPVFRISSICTSPNCEKLVTGSYSGQLCSWDINLKTEEIIPKIILIGHKHSVTCMVSTNEYVISSCEGGEMCRWSLDDGYCSKTNKSLFVHRHMQLFKCFHSNEELLFTCGDYSEIFIIHPFTLQVIYILYSKTDCNWISNFDVVSCNNKKSDLISGITPNGCLKLWEIDGLVNDSIYEIQSNILPVENVVDLKFNLTQTELLIVSLKYWTIFDSDVLNCIHKVEIVHEEKFSGGNFCDNFVVVWTSSGKFYIYNSNGSKYELASVLLDNYSKISLFNPAMGVLQTENGEKYLFKGDSLGTINIWNVTSHKVKTQPCFSAALKDNWVSAKDGFFNFLKYTEVSCCIYVLELDKFFVGYSDGTILCVPAIETIRSFYFYSAVSKPSYQTLVGHTGKINCLLYPYEKHSYFSKSHLVSGGSDFSVCLWDIFSWKLLYKFCIQSGEILRLLVPPEDCKAQVRNSVCSISSDHSVAVLNLKDTRCIILTSSYLFPVVTVNWKPLDDFLIVECFDGTVFVWQMETGHLDRVLDGVVAQEVLHACNEPNIPEAAAWNFYIHEPVTRKNSVKKEIFQIEEDKPKKWPFVLSGFLTDQMSESQIFMCDVGYILSQASSTLRKKTNSFDSAMNHKIFLLTQSMCPVLQKRPSAILEKIKQETGIFQEKLQYDKVKDVEQNCEESNPKKSLLFFNEAVLKLIQFFLSLMHFWGLNLSLDKFLSEKLGLLQPEKPVTFGILSHPGIYSLFLPTTENVICKSSSLVASTCLAMIALTKIVKWFFNTSGKTLERVEGVEENNDKDWWKELFLFYERISSNPKNELDVARPRIEILAKALQAECLPLRDIAQKQLTSHLHALEKKESTEMLEFWYTYLPHFKILDKTSLEKLDFENVDLKTVALVLFGNVGSDLKFMANDIKCQENYIYQTCASFVYLMLLQNEHISRFSTLQAIAVDFIGRGYIVWEQFLKIEKVLPVLFQMCENLSRISFERKNTSMPLDRRFTAHNALKSIALARTAAFINCLMTEINKIRLSLPNQNDSFSIENSKSEILSILVFLLEETPYIMLLYLSDIVSIFVYCIDFSHLKQENLSDLLPVMKKFRQVHHSVLTQKIAVGLGTGSLVLHDLKTGKAHVVPAHKDSVSAVKFSDDGKFLVTYSCYENRLAFWQILTGMFGLGNVRVKCTKSCQTYRIHDEEIRNHFEIAELTWKDNKSVVLSLCDGTDTIFSF